MAKRKSFDEKNKNIHKSRKLIIDTVFGRDDNNKKSFGYLVYSVVSPPSGAVVRVLIDSTNGDRVWTTVGVDSNVIEASWQALMDSIQFGLVHADDLAG